MNVLVTGGTGFVGQSVLRELHHAGHHVILLVRDAASSSSREARARSPMELRQGDVLSHESIPPAMQGADAVIHLVGIISEIGNQSFENVHAVGTAHVICAAQKAGVRRFVHMSALGTRPRARSRYHQSKWAAEELVRQSGLDFTIFRPSLIFGPRDHFVNLFAGIIRRSPLVPLLGRRTARFQPIFHALVAAAFTRSLDTPAAISQTYDLCGPETFTLAGLVDNILAVMGCKRMKVRVPRPIAWCQAAALEFVYPRLFRKAPPLNREQLLMLEEDNVGNPVPANEALKLKHPAFREAIAEYLAR